MEKICDKELCTSCSACYSICPTSAIQMVVKDGFYRPLIDSKLCVNCLQCQMVCPASHELPQLSSEQKVFACHVKDEEIRFNSSSGGFFSQISAQVLQDGGIVFGAGFADDFTIKHFYATDINELKKLRASKYVQSYIGNTFKEVKDLLKQGKKVLFSGTPCQIAGLRRYLSSVDTKNLLLIDLVCHGVPSPQVYKDFCSHLENQYQDKISKLSFRHKPNGWKSFGMKVDFVKGDVYFKDILDDPYLVGFLKNFFLNPSCYSCPYANTNRLGDITIADFWGYKDNDEIKDDDKGITLVITNNEKGLVAYTKAAQNMVSTEKTLAEAVAGNANLDHPAYKNKRYEEFWLDYPQKDFAWLIKEYFPSRRRPNV